MTRKVVSLTVHRNTREQRRRHAKSKRLVSAAHLLARGKQIDAYAVVAWYGDGTHDVAFDSGSVGMNVLPQHTSGAISRAIADHDVLDRLRLNSDPEDDGA